jgi:hypothetical protein
LVLRMLRRLLFPMLGAGMAMAGGVAAAEEAEPVVRGVAGLTALPFAARNESPDPIVCSAALAHWYSVEFGKAAHGESVQASLWYDPRTGETFVLNALKDRMPIQFLWCGIAGDAWANRAIVALPQRAGVAPAPLELTCAPHGRGLACR